MAMTFWKGTCRDARAAAAGVQIWNLTIKGIIIDSCSAHADMRP
jgi:hypothetical protein